VKSGSRLDLLHTSPVKVLGRRAEKTGSPAIGQPIFNIRREYYITLIVRISPSIVISHGLAGEPA
jgi:hypothetical protein